MRSAESPGRPVRRAAVVTHGKQERIRPALERLERLAERTGIELLRADGELEAARASDESTSPDLAVVLGGDGTMLRALNRFLGRPVPVFGVNFGRVGFLSSVAADDFEAGLERAFRGDYVVTELPTLEASADGRQRVGVNDVVATSSIVGRMIQLAWRLGGEDLGTLACDGIICATPSGSTAYNLSNGGPVLVWGLDAMAITVAAPHSLHARPLVVPRGRTLTVTNLTPDVPVTVLVDGHRFAEIGREEVVDVRLDDRRSLLASLPETTFFERYRRTFGS